MILLYTVLGMAFLYGAYGGACLLTTPRFKFRKTSSPVINKMEALPCGPNWLFGHPYLSAIPLLVTELVLHPCIHDVGKNFQELSVVAVFSTNPTGFLVSSVHGILTK